MDRMTIYEKSEEEWRKLNLSLPVYVCKGKRLTTVVSERLNSYVEMATEILSDTNIFDDCFHCQLNKLVKGLIAVFEKIDNCEFDNAYSILCEQLELDSILEPFKHRLESKDYYRARLGKGIKSNEMFHVPVVKNYLCKSNRFSESGYPALYLSESEDSCKKEIPEYGTMAKFHLHENSNLEVVDMTFLDYNNNTLRLNAMKDCNSDRNNNTCQKALHLMWPILMCCYTISYWCPFEKKQCPVERGYIEEYTFPQLFSRYLRKNGLADGIRYFTVRDETLDPNESNMADIVLFTKEYDESGYDEKLRSKFRIEVIP